MDYSTTCNIGGSAAPAVQYEDTEEQADYYEEDGEEEVDGAYYEQPTEQQYQEPQQEYAQQPPQEYAQQPAQEYAQPQQEYAQQPAQQEYPQYYAAENQQGHYNIPPQADNAAWGHPKK